MQVVFNNLKKLIPSNSFEQRYFYVAKYPVERFELMLRRTTAKDGLLVKSNLIGKLDDKAPKKFALVYKADLHSENPSLFPSSCIEGRYYVNDENQTSVEFIVVPNFDSQIWVLLVMLAGLMIGLVGLIAFIMAKPFSEGLLCVAAVLIVTSPIYFILSILISRFLLKQTFVDEFFLQKRI